MKQKQIKVGDKVKLLYDSDFEDIIQEGQTVTIIKILRKGEEHPGLHKYKLTEDHFWIKEVGDSPFAGLTRAYFE